MPTSLRPRDRPIEQVGGNAHEGPYLLLNTHDQRRAFASLGIKDRASPARFAALRVLDPAPRFGFVLRYEGRVRPSFQEKEAQRIFPYHPGSFSNRCSIIMSPGVVNFLTVALVNFPTGDSTKRWCGSARFPETC